MVNTIQHSVSTFVSAISWIDTSLHIRVFSGDSYNYKITEDCYDNGHWSTGDFSQHGNTVGATSWMDSSGQIHIRVYIGGTDLLDHIVEWCCDGGSWYEGSFSSKTGARGDQASAISWVDSNGVYIRVYVGNSGEVTEYALDPGKQWSGGVFTGGVPGA